MMADDITAKAHAETEIGWRRLPVARDGVLAIQLVDLQARAVDEHLFDRDRRKNVGAVELAAPPQHLGQTEQVRDGGSNADPRHLRVLFLEGTIGAEVAVAEMAQRAFVEQARRPDVARFQIATQPDGRTTHAKRREELRVHDLPEAALRRVSPP